MKRPKVTINCVADKYASAGERIVEVTNGEGLGCLVSIRMHEGKLIIEPYGADEGVVVRNGGKDLQVHRLSTGPEFAADRYM